MIRSLDRCGLSRSGHRAIGSAAVRPSSHAATAAIMLRIVASIVVAAIVVTLRIVAATAAIVVAALIGVAGGAASAAEPATGKTAGVAPAAAAAEGWKVGVARVKVTPEKSMWMAGYAARKKPSEGVVQELYAKALAFEDATGRRMVIVTQDLIGVPRALRERLEKCEFLASYPVTGPSGSRAIPTMSLVTCRRSECCARAATRAARRCGGVRCQGRSRRAWKIGSSPKSKNWQRKRRKTGNRLGLPMVSADPGRCVQTTRPDDAA